MALRIHRQHTRAPTNAKQSRFWLNVLCHVILLIDEGMFSVSIFSLATATACWMKRDKLRMHFKMKICKCINTHTHRENATATPDFSLIRKPNGSLMETNSLAPWIIQITTFERHKHWDRELIVEKKHKTKKRIHCYWNRERKRSIYKQKRWCQLFQTKGIEWQT